MYYYEKFQLKDIAIVLGLSEYEADQILAKVLGAVQTMLAARLGLERRAHNRRSFTRTKALGRNSSRTGSSQAGPENEPVFFAIFLSQIPRANCRWVRKWMMPIERAHSERIGASLSRFC